IDLVSATRTHPDLRLGASPRATLQLVRAARAYAALDDRDYVLPDDVQDLAVPVLAHRLLPPPEAQVERWRPEQVVTDLVTRLRLRPRRARPAPRRGARARAAAAVHAGGGPDALPAGVRPAAGPAAGAGRPGVARRPAAGERVAAAERAAHGGGPGAVRARRAGPVRPRPDRAARQARARLPDPLGRARTLPGGAADRAAGRPVRDGRAGPLVQPLRHAHGDARAGGAAVGAARRGVERRR